MSETTSPWYDLDAYIALPRLTGLTLSHDGTALLCAVSSLDADQTGYTSALWRVDVTGERAAQRLTRSVKGEAVAAFLRDGSLVFTSKRSLPTNGDEASKESETALWCLPAGGGEAYVLARRDGGWGALLTSPASDRVVFEVLAHAGAVDDEADAAKREDRRKKKVAAILHDGYPVRYWDHDLGLENPRLRTGAVIQDDGNAAGDLRLTNVAELSGDVGAALSSPVLSRDGSSLVAVWTDRLAHGISMTRIVAICPDTGERRVIASADDAEFDSPVISDDGSLVVCRRTSESSAIDAPDVDLWLIDAASGEGRVVAAGWDRWATPIAFSPDAATVYLTADEDGAGPIFALNIADDEVRRLTGAGVHDAVRLSADGSTLFALRTSYTSAGELVAIDTNSGVARVLRAPVDYPALPGRVERVETSAADGTRVPGWLVLPEGATAESPVPLTLWVHGGPLGSWNSWSWRWCPWLLASRGQAVLLPDPALSTGYGLDYIQRGWGRWGAEPYSDSMALTDAVEAREDIRDDSSTMMGGSFGGYMANWIATQTNRFRAIVSHASLWNLTDFVPTTDVPWYWVRELTPEMVARYSPHQFAHQIQTPMLVIHGDRDYRVPIGEGLALWWTLNQANEGDPADLPHRFLYFPD